MDSSSATSGTPRAASSASPEAHSSASWPATGARQFGLRFSQYGARRSRSQRTTWSAPGSDREHCCRRLPRVPERPSYDRRTPRPRGDDDDRDGAGIHRIARGGGGDPQRVVEHLSGADDLDSLLEAHKWVLSILQVAADVNIWATARPASPRSWAPTRNGAATTPTPSTSFPQWTPRGRIESSSTPVMRCTCR